MGAGRKQGREAARRDKRMRKLREKRYRRINGRIERGISLLAILTVAIFSVLDVLEKGDRRLTPEKQMVAKNKWNIGRK